MPKRLIDLTEADALNNGEDLVYVRQASGSRRDRKISTKRLLTESYSDIGGTIPAWDPEDSGVLPVLVWRRAAGALVHGWLDLSAWFAERIATVSAAITALSGALATETTARGDADTALAGRITTLENASWQTEIPATGVAALKLFGATAAGSSTDLDYPFGTMYGVYGNVAKLVSSFLLDSSAMASSTRAVTFKIHDEFFGVWATAVRPPGILVRYIPVTIQLSHAYMLRVYPPELLGGDAYLVLTGTAGDPVTYSEFLASFGSTLVNFYINFAAVRILV